MSCEDNQIRADALESGATKVVAGPAGLASDEASKIPAVVHAIRSCTGKTRPDTTVELYVTAILRGVEDIVGAVHLLETAEADSVSTAALSCKSPDFNTFDVGNDQLVVCKTLRKQLVRRQSAPQAFDMNAAVFVWRAETLLSSPRIHYPDTRLLVLLPEQSLDVDSELVLEVFPWRMALSRQLDSGL